MEHSAIIVGDCFSGYSQNQFVYTVSSFAKMLRAVVGGKTDSSALPKKIHWGQGVGTHERGYITGIISKLGRTTAPLISENRSKLAGRTHVHKCNPHNVLVSIPKRETDTRFVSDLIIDARNELLIDHATGQHVQGMVLLEACRQMFLAVTEEHFMENDTPVDTYFVIKSMGIKYKAFVFPIDAHVVYTLINLQRKTSGRIEIDCSISILQSGLECAVCEVSYTVFDADQLSAREAELARKTTHCFLSDGPAPAIYSDDKAMGIPVDITSPRVAQLKEKSTLAQQRL